MDGSQCVDEITHAFHNSTSLISPFLDATGHSNSGVLGGNLAWLGSPSECHLLKDSLYCLLDLITLVPSGAVDNSSFAPGHVTWGLCAVKSCNESSIEQNIQKIINVTSGLPSWVNVTGADVTCTRTTPATDGFFITISLLILLILLCTAASIYHYYLTSRTRPRFVYSIDERGPHTVTPPRDSEDSSDHNPLISPESGDIQSTEVTNVAFLRQILRHQPATHERVFTSFSVVKNLGFVLDTSHGDRTLPWLHSLRVGSIVWVILGQTAVYLHSTKALGNVTAMSDLTRSFLWPVVGSSELAIDTFFFISGLLVVYVNLHEMDRREGYFPWLRYYLHRYVRLTVPLALVLLLWMYIIPHIGRGPLWSIQMNGQPEACKQYWWTNLLYINNFYPGQTKHMCMEWTWYLAADMQLYILAPLVIIPLHRKVGLGLVMLVSGCVVSIAVTGVLISVYDVEINLTALVLNHDKSSLHSYIEIIFSKPYCRAAVYTMGMMLGYLLHTKHSLNISKIHSILGWTLSTGLALLLLYMPYPLYKHNEWPGGRVGEVSYGTMSHVIWGLVLGWIVIASHYRGEMSSILSWRAFKPLSHLVYMVYLTHPLILVLLLYSLTDPLYASVTVMTVYFLSTVVLSFAASTILVLISELPVHNLAVLLQKHST